MNKISLYVIIQLTLLTVSEANTSQISSMQVNPNQISQRKANKLGAELYTIINQNFTRPLTGVDAQGNPKRPNFEAEMQQKEKNVVNEIKKLIDNGANVNFQNSIKNGKSLLMQAAYHDANAFFLPTILNAGADLEMQDYDGNAALHYATTNKHSYEDDRLFWTAGRDPKIAEFLINAGAIVNLQNDQGNTSLLNIVKELPADYMRLQPRAFHQTPQEIAALLNADADPDIKNNNAESFNSILQTLPTSFSQDARIQQALKDYYERKEKHMRNIVEPEIVESIEETTFPPELAGVVAEYANIDMPANKKRKRQ